MQEEIAGLPAKPKKKKLRRRIIIGVILFIILYPICSLGLLYLIGPPKLKICKETTGLDDPPLKPDGTVDYLKYFNDVNSKDVTPENNFVNAWIDIVGVDNYIDKRQNEYLDAIGYDAAKKDEGCFVTVSDLKKSGGPKIDYNTLGFCRKRPWSAKQYPQMAEYVRQNAKAMNMLKKAVERPYFYSPCVSNGNIGTVSMVLPILNNMREMAKVLAYRANNLIERGRLDEAWSDVIAMRRLGLKLYDPGKNHYAFLINILVGIAIDRWADEEAVVVLANKHLAVEQVKKFHAEWRKYPTPHISAKKLMYFERPFAMDAMSYMYRNIKKSNKRSTSLNDNDINKEWLDFCFRNSDPNYVASKINYVYDLLEENIDQTVLEQHTRKPSEEMQQLNEMLEEKPKLRWSNIPQLWMPPNIQRRVMSDVAADMILRVIIPSLDKIRILITEEAVNYNLVDMGLALREYQFAKGVYPKKLSQLVPEYFKELPKDPFSGRDYIYKPAEDGFKLYSVGSNFIDDGGVVTENRQDGDIVLEIPLSEKKVTKQSPKGMMLEDFVYNKKWRLLR